jgi:hypothetical protein
MAPYVAERLVTSNPRIGIDRLIAAAVPGLLLPGPGSLLNSGKNLLNRGLVDKFKELIADI